MPELPEVETIKRGLEPVLDGARILEVRLNRPDLRFPFPQGFAAQLRGSSITGLARRAKYLLMHLDRQRVLACHLGMSGSFRIEEDRSARQPGSFHHQRSKNENHDHVVFDLAAKGGEKFRLIYNDPRRFGYMMLLDEHELSEHRAFARLGIEPTGNELDGQRLAQLFRGRKTPLKAALLDQQNIAGLGNIYVCEALWRAGLDPAQETGSISGNECSKLAEAVRSVIADAIAAGGSSLRDYVRADGSLGYFQNRFAVYDREGENCLKPDCAGTIRRDVQAGRSTFSCPVCQKSDKKVGRS